MGVWGVWACDVSGLWGVLAYLCLRACATPILVGRETRRADDVHLGVGLNRAGFEPL